MSSYLFRRLMRDRVRRLRRHAGAPSSHPHGAHWVWLLALNPVRAVQPRYAR